MKRLKLITLIILTVGCFTSCDFLNVEEEFNDTLPYDSVFSNKRNIERYMWATADAFGDEGALFSYPDVPGPVASDECFVTFGSGQF